MKNFLKITLTVFLCVAFAFTSVSAKASVVTEVDASKQVTVTYSEDVDAGNGLVEVTYNPEKATFVKVESDADLPDYNVDENTGTVTFAYVSIMEITAGEPIAKFIFSVGCEDTEITVTVKQLNADGKLNDESKVTLTGVGHDYKFVDFTWSDDNTSAVANFVCANDETHTMTLDATVETKTTEPTCEEAGKTEYTATVEYEGQTYTDTHEEEIESIGHDYKFVDFTWSDDNTSAVANFVCANDETHTMTLDATVEAKTTEPTCEEAGKTEYTATVEYEGQTYTDTREEEIESIGHDYKFVDFTWSDDNTSAVANFVCANDETHTMTLDATVTVEETKATAEKDGKKVYTATVEYEGQTYTETKEVKVPYKAVAETGDFVGFTTSATVMVVSFVGLLVAITLKKKEMAK